MATTIAVIVLLSTTVAGLLAYGRGPARVSWLLIGLPVVILFGALPFMVRGYVLTETAIEVKRLGWRTRLPLAGLKEVSGNADIMRGSLRLFGNGGVFAFSGEFWNRRLGRYRALATDPQRAVVLRYAKRVVVITPHDPQHFIMRARTLLKLSQFPA